MRWYTLSVFFRKAGVSSLLAGVIILLADILFEGLILDIPPHTWIIMFGLRFAFFGIILLLASLLCWVWTD